MILASQPLTALAEDQAPTRTETPASSSDTGEDASEPSSGVTNEAGESEENPTVDAETKDGESGKEADQETETETVAPDNASDEETKKEESVPEETPVDETPVVPAPAAETENTPVAKAMAPMNAPESQSLFMIGSDGYETLEEALNAADNMTGDITLTLTTDLKINKDRTIEYTAPNGAIYTKTVKVNATYTISQKNEGTITLDLNKHKLQGHFDINLSSPIQMIIKNGLLQGGNYFEYVDGTDKPNYDFEVTSPDASIIFQDLELDNIWAGYTAETDSNAPYAFQILRCRNDELVEDKSFATNAHSMTFGSRVKNCNVLIKDSRLYKLMSAQYWWRETGPSGQRTKVTLDNSVVSGAGNVVETDPSPVFNISTGGLLDQYNLMCFGSDDPNLHGFQTEHQDGWYEPIDEYNPPAYVANQTVRWTTFEQLESERLANPYSLSMTAAMMAPATTVKVGVIFEDGNEKDYPDLGLTCIVKTVPVPVTTGAALSSKSTYFEETRELSSIRHYDYETGTVSYSPYDPFFYVPSKFYNMQGNNPGKDMTVDAGATVVEYKNQNVTIANSSENKISLPVIVAPAEGNDVSNGADIPDFQEVYNLKWNDPYHSLKTSDDDGPQFYDYQLLAVRKTYTVDFDANGGNNAPVAQKSLLYYEDSIKDPGAKNMARDGYTFTGWYLDADATIEFKSFGTLLDSKIVEKLTKEGALKDGSTTITLYAGWKKNEEKPAQPSQTAKASSSPAVSFPRTSNPVSSTGKLFIPRTGVGAEPKSAE